MDEGKTVPTQRPRWSRTREARFLDTLAATCSVAKACEAADVVPTAAYDRRRRSAAFAEAWRVALLAGYDRLEAALLLRAGATAGSGGDDVQGVAVDPDLALRLLAMHHARGTGTTGGGRPQGRARRATEAETDAAILKQLAAIDRAAKRAKPRS